MKLYDNINSMALSNYGLITSAQAVELGVRLKDLPEWVKIGRLEKCWRGVYRISVKLFDYPMNSNQASSN